MRLVPSEAVHGSKGNITDFVHGSQMYHASVLLIGDIFETPVTRNHSQGYINYN